MTAFDRALFLLEMQAGVGLTAELATLEDFENSIGGAEKPEMRRAMATYRVVMPDGTVRFSSTCGLKIREAMRRAGFKARWLQPDYIPASVMSDIKTEGQRAHAVNLATPSSLPSPGDVVGLGWSLPTAHVLVVETDPTVAEDGSVTFDAVEAGQQTPAQLQACARKRHTWRWDARAKRYYDRSVALEPANLLQGGEREVSWWIDVSKLPAGGLLSPFARSAAPVPSLAPRGSGESATAPSAAPTVLRRGARGEAVRTWQKVIGATADGIFGPGTESRTRVWQAAHGLPVTGVVGQDSWLVALAPKTAVAFLEGIDVSHYQDSARFAEVAAVGIRFCFVKLGQGSHLRPRYEDSSAKKLCAGVRDAGLLLGGYHYEMARPEDARVQAEDFFEAWQRERCSLAELDVEWMQNEKASPEQFRDATATLLERWDELSGRATVFVYGSQSELDRALIHTIPGIGERPLSVAHYTDKTHPALPLAWKDWTLWQYTGAGTVPGITGDCDRYRFRGTEAELRAFGRSSVACSSR